MAACVLLAHKFSASDVKSVNVLTELERALVRPRVSLRLCALRSSLC